MGLLLLLPWLAAPLAARPVVHVGAAEAPSCIHVGVNDYLYVLPDQLQTPICVHLDVLPNVPSIIVSFEQENPSQLCITAQQAPGDIPEKYQCSTSNPAYVSFRVSPTQEHDYTFSINPPGHSFPPPTRYAVKVTVPVSVCRQEDCEACSA